MKRLVIPLLLVAGATRLVPGLLKRRMAPPQRPQLLDPGDLGLVGESVELASSSGTALRGWYIPAVRPAPAVVVLHGWGGNASLMLPLAPHLHRAGFGALFLDARNHGRSDPDDHVSMPRFAEDLGAAVSWLRTQPWVTSVGVIGHSVGAGAALLAASARNDIDAVVSVSAFADPREVMWTAPPLRRFPPPARAAVLRSIERTIGYRFEEIAPLSTVTRVLAPVLLVHGEADSVVPVSDLHRLAAQAPDARTLVIPGADHASLDAFEPHVDRILGFLSEHLVWPVAQESDCREPGTLP